MGDASAEDFPSHLRACLEPVLGKHTTGHAIKMGCEQLGIGISEINWVHAESIANALTPVLRTLLGGRSTEVVLDRIRRREGGPN